MVDARALLAAALAAFLAACSGSAPALSSPPPAAPPPPRQPSPEEIVGDARIFRVGGDLAGARARLEEGLRIAPASDEIRIELADLLLLDGKNPDRVAGLLAGVSAPDGRHHLLVARLSELRGDDAEAAAAYGRALLRIDDPDVRLRRALALERLGHREESIQELERVRARRPGDVLVRARLGEAYEAAGRVHEAEAELRAAAEEQPERPAGWERLARFYERAGRAPEAKEAWAKARETRAPPTGRTLRPLLPSRR